MSGRMEMPRVPPEVEAGFPEHIQNHIYDIRGRSASYSSPSNQDGEKPKRRGPKPDSKPPLTRKQELNRQAQRTHRQRKEFYVKSLEKDVASVPSRLRETFTIITKEKTALLRENMRLKEILEQHGIVYDPDMDYGYGQNQYPRLTGTTITDTPITATGPLPPDTTYDHIGVDFVLALERPCMEHLIPLSTHQMCNPEADFHGHALMITCPPESWSTMNPGLPWDFKGQLDIEAADLSILFDLSNRLQLEGEMTPIAVWATIARHERFSELTMEDFDNVKHELVKKIKCYGFGAVLDEWDVSDAMSKLFAQKLEQLF
ncbi:hypothetical protein FPQ18DRAFT_421295 [Pyronema domesticum]|nr:hypothetical protein FPQ18DRAFT_421295 [Pyronema domesticum]